MSVKAIPGAAQALEHVGSPEMLTREELGTVLDHIPAEQRAGRSYLEHDELDSIVSRAAGTAPIALVERVQRTTNELLHIESAEERETFFAKILTPLGAIIGLLGAVIAFFNPLVGAIIAVLGAGGACLNELAAWWHKSSVEKHRDELQAEHRDALVALLEHHNRHEAARRARETAVVAPAAPSVAPNAARPASRAPVSTTAETEDEDE